MNRRVGVDLAVMGAHRDLQEAQVFVARKTEPFDQHAVDAALKRGRQTADDDSMERSSAP